ncbi:cytochrome c biogenesis protein ResB [Rothia sp. ZJ932]|uniref:cytochrome c biogenesis protein ResB n=1 Tax=Rothia sp. ZJ932 TaxID=2810516 RepID=UPI001967078C|nr:cytochrome c biogenesis protein ResB [Rothia sp. ZJ932]QRZ61988.1 cytochrome c biogenesis protein ResB [Rothia sp. ZJ932]
MSTEEKRSEPAALGVSGMLRWAWAQLTKMNTAMFLLLMVAVAAVPGSVFPQRIQNPGAVNDYIKAHPTWGPIADKIQLFDVFSSAWFSAIYILLFISLVGCVLPRAVQHYAAMKRPPARTPKNLSRMPQYRTIVLPQGHSELTAHQAIQDAVQILKKRGYRVEERPATAGENASVGAERGYLREVGNILFHTAMIGVLVGVAVGSLFGYYGQRIMVEGDTHVNSLISYDLFTPGTNYNPDWLTPYSMTLNELDVTYDRQVDSATYGQDYDYSASMTINPGNGEEPYEQVLKVNEPVRFNGASHYLIGNGYAPIITVRDGDGNITFEGPVVGLFGGDRNYTSSIVLKVPDTKPDQLAFIGMFLPTGVQEEGAPPYSADPAPANPMLVLQSYYGDLGLDDGTPQNVYVVDTTQMKPLNTMAMGNGIILDSQNTQATLPDGRGTVTFQGVKRYVGMDIHYDPGKMIVLGSVIVVFFSLIASLFIPRRRVWVRAQDTADGLTIEYGLLARGEDPRLATEADKLTELFAETWNLEFADTAH